MLAYNIICECFDIPEAQKFCLQNEDNLYNIYNSFHYTGIDDMEFERLYLELSELSADFEAISLQPLNELTVGRIVTILDDLLLCDDVPVKSEN